MATTMVALSSTASIVINISSRAMAVTAGFAPAVAKDMLINGL